MHHSTHYYSYQRGFDSSFRDPFTNVCWSGGGIGGRPGLPGQAWPPAPGAAAAASVPQGPPQQQQQQPLRLPLSSTLGGSKEYRSGWGQKGHVVKPSIAMQASCYEEIKRKCLEQNALWEDSEFPANDASLFYSHSPPRRFEWKRPSEICDDPQLFVGDASRFDIQQGELGDCWLLAAVASLTCNKSLLQKVVPGSQSFGSEDYAGIFHFQFWQYGQWVDVIVDDRLPTYNGKLVFLHSPQNNEFWSALLEKAYAKLCGSYEALKGGSQAEAMEDFTGGLTERFELQKVDQNHMLKIMLKAVERGSLMGCAIDAAGGVNEQELATGLLTGHAYSVTDVRMVDITTPRMSGKIPLVRVRNPWGNSVEWKGAWSDKSREWNLINDAERKELGLTFTDDGEFWMSFKDFLSNFTTLELCSLDPDSMGEADEGRQKFKWEKFIEQGQWIRRVNAGGCRNYLDTFWTNPQYHVTVTDPDDQDDNDMCTLIVGLMQKDRRKLRKTGADLLTIGYAIYQLKEPAKHSGQLDVNFFKYNASFAKSPSFINTREICGRHQVPPGSYVIVPSTFEPNQEANFLLRIFTEKPNVTKCADEPTGICEAPTYDNIFDPATLADPAQQARLKEVFKKMAGDDMEIDAYELMDILNAAFKEDTEEFKFDGFSIETSRSMVALSDTDHSGKLGFDEFIALWQDLRNWKGVFKKFDADNSGQFNSYELRLALKAAGFTVSNSTFNCLVMRFSNKKGFIEFDEFVLCAIRLKSLFATFKARSRNGPQASFAIDEFVQMGIYC